MIWIYIIGGYLICLIIFWVVLIKSAPIGYQDKSGFHYGKPKDTDNAR